MKLINRCVKYSIPAALFVVGLSEPVQANNGLRATATHDFDFDHEDEDIEIIDFMEHKFINNTYHGRNHEFENEDHINSTMSRQLLPLSQELSYNNVAGMWVRTKVSVREIARTGKPVASRFKNFHSKPDGAHCFKKGNGWTCLSNSEEKSSRGGGVYAMDFDSRGDITDYRQVLGGTTRNCAGGATKQNTWISCEETGRGYCWEVDPSGDSRELRGLTGRSGRFEAYAYYGNSHFVTEDHKQGPLTRNVGSLDSGSLSYLVFTSKRTYTWSTSLKAGRNSAKKYYPGLEGVTVQGSHLYFISKKKKRLFKVNLEGNDYSSMKTGNPMSGYGSFSSGPDNIHSVGSNSLYFTEEGKTPGVFVMNTNTKKYSTIFQLSGKGETTGISFNPSRTIMYACEQRKGILYEFKFDNGDKFD
jgi:hypothetical protein